MDVLAIALLLPWLVFVCRKIYSMLVHNVVYNLRFGIKISQTFVLKLRTEGEGVSAAMSYLSGQRGKSNRLFQTWYDRCTNPPIRLLFSLIYKWPVMIMMASALLYYFSWLYLSVTSVILSVVCVLLLVSEIVHEVVARLTLGQVDNYRRYVVLDPGALNNPHKVFYDRNRILRDFFATILIQLICFTWTFSALYFSLGRFDTYAFNKVLNNPIDAVYFAVVIVGTIGFGDITPVKELSKALLIFNVGTIMLFVVFITGHFFATLSDTPENIVRKC